MNVTKKQKWCKANLSVSDFMSQVISDSLNEVNQLAWVLASLRYFDCRWSRAAPFHLVWSRCAHADLRLGFSLLHDESYAVFSPFDSESTQLLQVNQILHGFFWLVYFFFVDASCWAAKPRHEAQTLNQIYRNAMCFTQTANLFITSSVFFYFSYFFCCLFLTKECYEVCVQS